MKERPSWEEYFLSLASVAATRSSCIRAQVGAVLVKDNRVLATGYNGAPRSRRTCLSLGNCLRNDKGIQSGTQIEVCRAVGSHAESNAIALAAKTGVPTDGATMYMSGHTFPCAQCQAMMLNAGIDKVVYTDKSGKVCRHHLLDSVEH